MNQSRKEDQEMLEAGRPYLRGILAFLLRMRDGRGAVGQPQHKQFYDEADAFLTRLDQDLVDQEFMFRGRK